MKDFLQTLLDTQSPSSYEKEILEAVQTYAAHFCEVTSDVMGNLYLHAGSGHGPRVMLSAHCDEVGFQIVYVDADGFAFVRKVGGIDRQTFPGAQVLVMSSLGEKVPGVFGKKAPHLQTAKEKEVIPELEGMWIDMGFTSREEALHHVAIGDFATVSTSTQYLDSSDKRIVGRALDNKLGVYTMVEALRRVAAHGDLSVDLTAVVTTQEEIGCRGAKVAVQRIKPDIAFCIDAGTATDIPTVSKKERGEIKLGYGPVLYKNADNTPLLLQFIMRTADSAKLPYQIGLGSKITGGTESAYIQLSGDGVSTANISIPNRYMHSGVEMCSMADVENTITLLSESILSLDSSLLG